MSVLKVNSAQIGQSLTSTNNFTWYQPSIPDGTVRLGVGNAGATSLDALVINSSGALTLQGTANGVAYLNGSKVLTTGSALTFDGSTLATTGTMSVDGEFRTYGGRLVMYRASGASYIDWASGQDLVWRTVTSVGGASAAEQMRLTSTGLGIGTSSPASYSTRTLEIYGSSSSAIKMTNAASGTGSANGFDFEWNGNLNFVNRTASGYQAFWTNSVERMRIDSSGNVGIGTSSFTYASSGRGVLELNGSTNSVIGLKYGDTASMYLQGSSAAATVSSAAAIPLILGTNNTERMRIDSSGNLLVGTTGITSGWKMAVNGAMYSQSSISATGGDPNFGAGGVRVFMDVGGGAARLGTLQGGTTANTPLTFYIDGSERMRITAGGEVYIAGTTDQGAYNLQCNGTGVWGAGAYVNGSDAALKENVTTLDNSLGLINAMRPVTFTYKEDYSKDRAVQTGFIAQELQEVLAGKDYLDGIVQAGPEYLNVAYQNLIPLLVKSIQELTARVEELESK